MTRLLSIQTLLSPLQVQFSWFSSLQLIALAFGLVHMYLQCILPPEIHVCCSLYKTPKWSTLTSKRRCLIHPLLWCLHLQNIHRRMALTLHVNTGSSRNEFCCAFYMSSLVRGLQPARPTLYRYFQFCGIHCLPLWVPVCLSIPHSCTSQHSASINIIKVTLPSSSGG